MKAQALLLLTGLLVSSLAPRSQEQEAGKEPRRRSSSAATRFFQEEGERVSAGLQGSWMLTEYFDPAEALLEERANGFATFHDGFLTLILALDTFDATLFGASARLLLQTGAYRYRLDEQGNLQLASVLSYTNASAAEELEREPSNSAYEYFARIEDGLLELRNSDGVRLTFRKVAAGQFPDSALRKLEARRGGVEHWEVEGETPR